MSAAPQWLDDVVSEFGRSAGIQGLALGERGIAALAGDNGTTLLFEYDYPRLTMMMTVEVQKTSEIAQKVLALVVPGRNERFTVRAGLMPHSDKAFFATLLEHEMLTQPTLMEVFTTLRRLADRFVGGAV